MSDSSVAGVQDLTVVYAARGRGGEVHALSGVSLSVFPGQVHAVVGESGSGKSTLGLTMMGLLPGSARIRSGHITLGNVEVTGYSEREWSRERGDRVALVMQNPSSALNPSMTIGAHFRETLTARERAPAQSVRERTVALLSDVGLEALGRRLKAFPHELSGGMQQRICIALALARDPIVLVADEPTSALDASVTDRILNVLRDQARKRNLGLMLITHDLGVVASIADHVTVLKSGRATDSGAVRDLFHAEVSEYAEQLITASRVHIRRGLFSEGPPRQGEAS